MSARGLRPLGAALVTLGLVGCASEPTAPEGYTSMCDGDILQLVEGFRPAKDVDYLAFRRDEVVFSPGAAEAGVTTTTLERRGTPCATAKDKGACESALGRARALVGSCLGTPIGPKFRAPEEGAPDPRRTCTVTYLVFTRGDEVGLVVSDADVRSFFGAIDSPQEAAYVAQRGGEIVTCQTTPAMRAAYAVLAEGIGIVAQGAAEPRIVRVAPDGTVSLVADGK